MDLYFREPEVETITDEGIPSDFSQIMHYFNRGLRLNKGMYNFIPRKKPITPDEIKRLWVPSVGTNLNLLAVVNQTNKIVGSATVFYDPGSNAYGKDSVRKPGELALTIDPDLPYQEVAKDLYSALISRLKDQDKKAILHTDADFSDESKVMEELGYQGRLIEVYQRYKDAGLSGKVFEFDLP